jgi:hypothetical protein
MILNNILRLPLFIVSTTLFWGCTNPIVQLQTKIKGDWIIEKIIFTPASGILTDSIVNYSSESRLIFTSGKAQIRNPVKYNLEKLKVIEATYVIDDANSVLFNDPCCNIMWEDIYLVLKGRFKAEFYDINKMKLSGIATFNNIKPQKDRESQIYLRKNL